MEKFQPFTFGTCIGNLLQHKEELACLRDSKEEVKQLENKMEEDDRSLVYWRNMNQIVNTFNSFLHWCQTPSRYTMYCCVSAILFVVLMSVVVMFVSALFHVCVGVFIS